MLFYLICLVGLGIIVYNTWNESDDQEMMVMAGLFTTTVVAMLGGITSLCISLSFSENPEISKVLSHNSSPIVSMKNNQSLSGSFFLGSGGIGSEEKYYFMYQVAPHSYKRGTEYTSDVVIVESDEPPSLSDDVVLYTPHHTIWWPDWLLITTTRVENKTLTVPKNTVIQHFQVD